mmetsp:Transcript_37709/g.102537  ORF Transcript_37709/g.102537 Transcript_37709/m.102537 type:complete len:133 (-) Transcript_37709:3501-3899(-)
MPPSSLPLTRTPPMPQTSRMTTTKIEFPGFATEGECERQLALLRSTLLDAGLAAQAADGYRVLFYNPPQTLPFLRRNELVVFLDDGTTNSKSDSDKWAEAAFMSAYRPGPGPVNGGASLDDSGYADDDVPSD